MSWMRPQCVLRCLGSLLVLGSLCHTGCRTPRNELGTRNKTFFDQVSDTMKSTLNSSYHDPHAEESLGEAQELFAAEKYEQAQPIFAKLADNTYNPTQLSEKARFNEAECARMRNRLPEAVEIYNRYLQDHPGGLYSRTSAERMYAIAEVWLKETMADEEAKRTQGGLSVPKLPNPFDNTRPTFDPEGVLVKTLENITVGAPTSDVADKAMFWAGYLHYIRGRYDDSDHFFSSLVDMYKDSPLRQEAARLAIDSKNRSTGGAPYDGQKSSEALQLVHNIEASEPEYRNDPEKQKWIMEQKLGIRDNQAERDYEFGEYYRRTKRYGSAYFYYELVKRRYPGSRYSDLAALRIEEMKQIQEQKEADRAAGKISPLEALQERVDRIFNKPPTDAGTSPAKTAAPLDAKTAPIVNNTGLDGR